VRDLRDGSSSVGSRSKAPVGDLGEACANNRTMMYFERKQNSILLT